MGDHLCLTQPEQPGELFRMSENILLEMLTIKVVKFTFNLIPDPAKFFYCLLLVTNKSRRIFEPKMQAVLN